jgi:hypothetical protein
MTDMDDARLEALLRQVRPAAPPPRLRAQIVAAPRPAPRAWPWVTAAAAMLAITIVLPRTTVQPRGRTLQPSAWEAEQLLLAEMLGGDAEAQRVAEQIVAINELRAAVVPVPPSATHVESQ